MRRIFGRSAAGQPGGSRQLYFRGSTADRRSGRFRRDFDEEAGLKAGVGCDSVLLGGRSGATAMMGQQCDGQASLFTSFASKIGFRPITCCEGSTGFSTRHVAARTGAVLQPDRPPLDRSGTDDPHAGGGLLLWHPLGAAAVRRGRSQLGVPHGSAGAPMTAGLSRPIAPCCRSGSWPMPWRWVCPHATSSSRPSTHSISTGLWCRPASLSTARRSARRSASSVWSISTSSSRGYAGRDVCRLRQPRYVPQCQRVRRTLSRRPATALEILCTAGGGWFGRIGCDPRRRFRAHSRGFGRAKNGRLGSALPYTAQAATALAISPLNRRQVENAHSP
jgi:hypothetical protein